MMDATVVSEDDPADILSTSLQSLYGFSPITFSTAGSIFTYPVHAGRVAHLGRLLPEQIELATPDTDPSNWSLHASSIWVSSLYIADHLEELQIDAICHTRAGTGDGDGADSTPIVHVLELGASGGLPSILLAHLYPCASVVASDYPDDCLIRTLSDNIHRNGASERCRAVPHAWGTDPEELIHRTTSAMREHDERKGDRDRETRFDVVLAADTLWNPELHAPFLDTLCGCLKRSPDARVHLVAGLHTGRYTIQAFLDGALRLGFLLLSATEREVGGAHARPWDVSRAEGEDERERRRWVVWMILKWGDEADALT